MSAAFIDLKAKTKQEREEAEGRTVEEAGGNKGNRYLSDHFIAT